MGALGGVAGRQAGVPDVPQTCGAVTKRGCAAHAAHAALPPPLQDIARAKADLVKRGIKC